MGPEPPMIYGPEPEPISAGPRTPVTDETCEADHAREVSRPRGPKPALDQLVDYEDHRRMIDAGSSYDAGDQVVGSHHNFRVAAPGNGDAAGRPALVLAAITRGGDVFSTDSGVPTPIGAGTHVPGSHTFDVVFQPSRAGVVTGELMISMRWADGHIERERIQLHGRAHPIEAPEVEAPAPTPSSTAPAAIDVSSTVSAPGPGYPQVAADHLADATTRALASAKVIHNEMIKGLNAVKSEAMSYELEKERDPIWWDLAELALTITTAGLAAGAAKAAEPGFMKMLGIAKDEARTSASLRGIEKTFEYGLRDLGRKAGGAALASAKTVSAAASSDLVTNFFMAQEEGISTYDADLTTLINDEAAALRPLMHTASPELAARSMTVLDVALAQTANQADVLQTRSSSAAWVGLQARAHLGSHTVRAADGTVAVVSDLADARFVATSSPLPLLDVQGQTGVLDIRVSLGAGSPSGSGPAVEGARLHGVALSTLKRLEKLDLVANRIPVRIVVDKSLVITRDEIGNVRLAGDMLLVDPTQRFGDPEAQFIPGATKLADLVLSRSLASWGVTIEDDDGSVAAKNQRRGAR